MDTLDIVHQSSNESLFLTNKKDDGESCWNRSAPTSRHAFFLGRLLGKATARTLLSKEQYATIPLFSYEIQNSKSITSNKNLTCIEY